MSETHWSSFENNENKEKENKTYWQKSNRKFVLRERERDRQKDRDRESKFEIRNN